MAVPRLSGCHGRRPASRPALAGAGRRGRAPGETDGSYSATVAAAWATTAATAAGLDT